jgi:histidinol-phosphate/aromatic aminotransferase/cobyric acid decarboxylase-like protein
MPVDRRDELAEITPVVHGAVGQPELAARGLSPADVVDFSVSTNPLGPPPAVLEAVRAISSEGVLRYPDPSATPLRRALAAGLGLDPGQVIAGNGSSELIWSLALAYARPAPATVLICTPTFGEYARASRLLGAGVREVHATPETAFRLDPADLSTRIRRARPRLVWLCNPNNPSGGYVRRRQVELILEGCAAAGALLVVDEAYLPFVDDPDSLLDLLPSGHLFL